MSMKCKICGKRANSLAAMNKHYKKAHPGHNKKARAATKAREAGGSGKPQSTSTPSGMLYCPVCGRKM